MVILLLCWLPVVAALMLIGPPKLAMDLELKLGCSEMVAFSESPYLELAIALLFLSMLLDKGE